MEEKIIENVTKETVEEYFTDDKVKKQLDELSIHFNEVSRGNWINIPKLLSKGGIKNPKELTMMLDLLVMSKRAFVKKKGDELIYKITLNLEQRKKVIENYIKELEVTLENLKKELQEM